MRRPRFASLSALLAFSMAAGLARGDDPLAYPLRDGDTVLFLGDSITQGGAYITDLEAYLLTRSSERTFTLINHGLSSETAAGKSEPDHDPRRPCVHDRFDRDGAAWKPDVLVACYGMNDGTYLPPDMAPMREYQQGITRLIERAKKAGIERIVLMTPPPFDPYRRQPSEPDAAHFGYRFPAVDYDDTLAAFSGWLVTLEAPPALRVVDLHTAINEQLRLGRREHASFHLAGDAVHPGPTGHSLMAATILRAWGPLNDVDAAELDVREAVPASSDAISDIARDGRGVAFTWTAPLPWPLAEGVERAALDRAGVAGRSLRLKVAGLPAGAYVLSIESAEGTGLRGERSTTAEELSSGVDLAGWPEAPPVVEARRLRSLLEARNGARYVHWRQIIADPARADDRSFPPGDEERTKEIRTLARPRAWRVTVRPAD